MCRLFVLFVCAHFFMSGGQMVSPHTVSATPANVSTPQALATGGASVLADTGLDGNTDLHSAAPLLADLPSDLPELSNHLTVTALGGTTSAGYDLLDLAGPPRPFLEGPRRPPRPDSVSI
jgi:hypothetical protein